MGALDPGQDHGPIDVAVIGGGPAGAAVATFLAERGRKVTVFEKHRHPRFHVGESLLPKNLPILERLGVAEEVAKIGMYKPGAEFVSPNHDVRQVFDFGEALDPRPTHAYQVQRDLFDEILVRNAQSKGVEVHENCAVTSVDFDATGCDLTLEEKNETWTCRARFLIDASGRDGFLARRMDLRQRSRVHNSAAMFAHFEGVPSAAWTTPGNIGIYWFEHGWIWLIPLRGGRTSIGAVCIPDYLKTRQGSLDAFFMDTLRLCPKVWDHMAVARRVISVHGAGNFSYSAKKAFGDGYLLLGDAYAFVDPVFSSGVFIAMRSAELAADAVEACLDQPAIANKVFRAYQRRVDFIISRFTWFIYRFNAPALRNLFMAPREFLRVRGAVISLLVGDVAAPGLAWRLAIFRGLFAISRLVSFRHARTWEKRKARTRDISVQENEVSK
jgi:flavin-dependent dehydrogenase